MEMIKQLSKYEGSSINIWIEDRSGEAQTKPKAYTLYKVEQSNDRQQIQFYLNETQFLSIPVFDNRSLTKLEMMSSGEVFVSHDVKGKLLYWIYFEERGHE
jgi:hypothetical protein